MPRINTSFEFLKRKETTIPVVQIPKKVKDALCIDRVHPNGIFKLEPGEGTCLYDQSYIFEDINYKNKDEDKKMSTLLEIMKLFKSLDFQIKFTIANEQQDMKQVVSEIFKPIHGEEYPIIEKGIGRWINQKIHEGTRDIRRVMYLTVTCRSQSFEAASAYFVTLDTALQGVFLALGSRLYRMSGEERLAVLQKMLRVGSVGIIPQNLSPDNDSWKNQILPISILSGEDCLKINNRYVSVLVAQDYDATLNEEKVVHSLTDALFPTYITLDIEPVKRRILRDKLLAAHTNNEQAISMENDQKVKYNQYGTGPSYLLGKKKSELESMMSQVDENDEDGIFLGMLVLVPADDMEQLMQRVDILRQIANTNGYTLEPYYHRQLKALNTALPIGGRQVNNMRALLTSSAVAFQPFYSKDLQDENGIVLGMNRTTKRLLRGNKKKLKNPHSMIAGHTGSGKSLFAKLTEISQTLIFTDDDIFYIDPNNEIEEYVRIFGGQYFDFTPQCKSYLNPFEVPQMVWESDGIVQNRFIAKKCDFGGRFVAACMKGITITQIYLDFVEETIRIVYEEYFNGKNFQEQPTLMKIWERLKKQQEEVELEKEKNILFDIVKSLKSYTTGVYDMFAHSSNIDINNRLVGFGLKNIPENAREPIMLTLMHSIQMRVEFNQQDWKASVLMVDESQVLCKDEFAASELLYAVETYRKCGGIITFLFQNLKHALDNPRLRDMLSNCSCKIFFDQGGVDAEALAQIQELSQEEYFALNESKPGYGLLVWDTQVYLLDAIISSENELFPYIDTNFHEKAKAKNEKEREERGVVLKERILSLISINPMNEQTICDMCAATNTEKQVIEAIKQLVSENAIEKKQDRYYLLKG